jgi:cysteinyl-tRNA synthetase
MEGQKMSKSLGNVVTVEKALAMCTADELRFYFLSVHYRKETDLSGFRAAQQRLEGMRDAARRLAGPEGKGALSLTPFEDALNDDFDTPRALRWVGRTLSRAAEEDSSSKASELAWAAVRALEILGVNLLETP